MIALGLTAPEAQVPAPCLPRPGPEATLVMAPDAAVPHRTARLALQVQAHRALPVFLPFAGRARATEAWAWAQAHPVTGALEAQRGQGQITVLFRRRKRPGAPRSGADWLRTRTAEAQGQARLVACLDQLATEAAPQPFVIQPNPDRVALHLLVPKPESSVQERAWAARLAQPRPETQGWRATLTGGWPPAAFWAPPEQELPAA